MVQLRIGSEPPIWVLGFVSKDKKGIVYQHPHRRKTWCFFREIETYPVYQRPLNKFYSDGKPRRFSMGELLAIGIMNEVEGVRVLRPLLKPLYVYAMPGSGAHTGGTDIIVTKNEEKEITPDCVDRCLYALSMVPLSSNNIAHRNTPPKEWFERVGEKGVYVWVVDRYTDHEKYEFLFVTRENIHLFNKYGTTKRKFNSVLTLEEFTNRVRKVL